MSINIEVKRERQSVTQGTATIYINDNKVLTFGDDMYLQNNDGTFTNGFNTVENARHYGPVIGGWGSIKPDSDFIMSLIYHHSELFQKAVFAADEKQWRIPTGPGNRPPLNLEIQAKLQARREP